MTKHLEHKHSHTNKTGLQGCSRKGAFTLAEVLITLAIIGIVAALTIPALINNHNEKAWAVAKDVFAKKLDIALKSMNTDGTLTGYSTTVDFVNALQKNIKINQICTDDVTKCFAKSITWGLKQDKIANIGKDKITYSTRNGQDWAETVGVRFSNGVNALIAYNKNCKDEPFNNQYSPAPNCIGIIYDVQANKKPNTYGKDIDVNANIARIDGKGLCVYELPDGTCFSKILGPHNGGYTYLSYNDCVQAKTDGKIDVDACYEGNDYYAGMVLACGGKKEYLPSMHQLALLATDLYNYEVGDRDAICGADCPNSSYTYVPEFPTITAEKVSVFSAQSPDRDGSFIVWSSQEMNSQRIYERRFRYSATGCGVGYMRDNWTHIAICLGE